MKYLIPLVLLFAISARADVINHIDAQANWNNAVTFDGSFNWDVTTNSLVQGSTVTESSGLGPFALTFASTYLGANWLDSLGDVLQINFDDHAIPASLDTLGTFGAYAIELWNAQGGFYFPNNLSATPTSGSVTITDPPDTTQVPEPATWLMLIASLAGIAIFSLVRT